MMPKLGGSYEEVPSDVVEYAKRDRRWSQGSLQHLRLLPMKGLKWMNRLHFLLGAMGYVSVAALVSDAPRQHGIRPRATRQWAPDGGPVLHCFT